MDLGDDRDVYCRYYHSWLGGGVEQEGEESLLLTSGDSLEERYFKKIFPNVSLLFPVSNGDSPVATTFPLSNYIGF